MNQREKAVKELRGVLDAEIKNEMANAYMRPTRSEIHPVKQSQIPHFISIGVFPPDFEGDTIEIFYHPTWFGGKTKYQIDKFLYALEEPPV